MACLLIALMLASACTDSESSSSAPGVDHAPEELALVDQPVLRLGLSGPPLEDRFSLPASVDPSLTNPGDQSAVILTDLLYDGLTEVVGRTDELRPGLALSWEANTDFTQWDFVLDPERTNASEVKASFERLVESDGLLSTLLDDVLGAEAFRSGDVTTVQGFVAVDDETFRVRLLRPNAGLAWLLSGIGFSVVGDAAGMTGRYVVADESLNSDGPAPDGSPDGDPGGGPDPADGLDSESILLRSDEGSVELVWGVDAEGLHPDSGPMPSASYFIVLSGASVEMADVLKREAVVAGIDGEALAQAGGLLGVGGDGIVSSALAGFEPGGCVWCEIPDERKRDLVQVIPTVEPLIVGYNDGEQRAVAELLVDQLSGAGFLVSAVQMMPSELATAVVGGDVDVFLFGWTAPAGSLDGTVGPLFASTGPSNVFGIGWDEVDELLTEARLTGDDQERWGLLRQAEVKALSQFIAVPLGSPVAGDAGVSAGDGVVVRADGSFDLVGVE